ncbi:DUF2231 domain-containing protein [Methylobacterium sp. J-030]|uniref:DUF2231 domain-containing protein n=1 Tax=Methylobacterium sp. J-030 TaxID=2836627 RepID=UPI0028C4CCC4|nr:DUF2231 domain-containing protein [Methylobacterium sp. J-030]
MARQLDAGGAPRPLHPLFVGLGGAFLIAALFTDSMYFSNALMQWANFSAWLITGGLVLALIAALVLVLDFVLGRAGPISWSDFGLLTVAALLSIVNVFIHTRDGWTSVVPSGITVSAIVAILLLVAGLRGWCVTGPKMPAQGDNA